MNEEWKSIVGEQHYEVSNCGRVRSLPRRMLVMSRYGFEIFKNNQGRILRSHPNGKYLSVMFHALGKRHYVHRLVAEAFKPKQNGKPEVNHINGNKLDNRSENLEWTNRSDNMYHSTHVLGKKSGQFGLGRVRIA